MRVLSASVRRASHVWRSPRLWQRRVVFLLGAIAVGLAAAGFAAAADVSLNVFFAMREQSVIAASIATVLGFLLCAEITRRVAPGARGSGIPQAIAARRRGSDSDRDRLIGLKVTALKILLTLVGLSIGAAVGREGPTVQVGACVMFLAGRFAGLRQRSGIVLAGAAAGVAGAFNTPLAGVVFAIEELAKSFDRRVNMLVIAAVAIAGLTSIGLVGNYHYFGTAQLPFELRWLWTAVPVCGVAGGIAGGLFSGGVVHVAFNRSRIVARLRARPLLFAVLCGTTVALLGLATDGFANGTSYQATRLAIEGGASAPWWFGFAKLAATFCSSISGIPGGLFSPSLSVGAALARAVDWMLPNVPTSAVLVLMMAAYFSAVVQAPLTAFVIVLEMTADPSGAVPLMLVALLAAGISRILCPVPLYHALSHTF